MNYFVLSTPSQNIVLKQGQDVRVGRGQELDFHSCLVSRMHALVGIDEIGVYITDVGTSMQGSANGTFVNGKRIEPMTRFYVTRRDVITFGHPVAVLGATAKLEKFRLVCAA